ncbi:unnamed protein product [Brachionus calyciflorus]|uniref:Uncharacterized protein n=1 Tax=Brachionus calyciflorus TaxID=104777 RepID=A0A814L5K3_9BILA|nr:unnamed protein product [Brachionus calyciflorus]
MYYSWSNSVWENLVFKRVLVYNPDLFYIPPKNIIYCYSAWESSFDNFNEISPYGKFHKRIPDIDELEPNLIFLDDLIKECEEDPSIQKLFTIDSHHKNFSVFFITQNIFSKGKFTRTLNLNSHYLILFNNPREGLQIGTLEREMFPNKVKFFMEAFEDAAKKPHGYLMIDLKQKTESFVKLYIWRDLRIIYTSKD